MQELYDVVSGVAEPNSKLSGEQSGCGCSCIATCQEEKKFYNLRTRMCVFRLETIT